MKFQKELFGVSDNGFRSFGGLSGVVVVSPVGRTSWTTTVAELGCRGLTTLGDPLEISSSIFWDFLNQDHFLWSEVRTALRRGDAGCSSIGSSSQGTRECLLVDIARVTVSNPTSLCSEVVRVLPTVRGSVLPMD